MTKINSKQFNFNFFLSDSIKVKSLEHGALKYGGATRKNKKCYSNIEGNEYITINDNNNKLAIFIPSTINVNKKVNNKQFRKYAIDFIRNNFNCNNVTYEKSRGSWYSEDLKKVVYDRITIVSFEADTITETDIKTLTILAEYIKNRMSQEGVTITVNSAMAIV